MAHYSVFEFGMSLSSLWCVMVPTNCLVAAQQQKDFNGSACHEYVPSGTHRAALLGFQVLTAVN